MANKFLVAIDLNQFELQNARIQNLGSDPGSPVEGQIYHNTATHVTKLHNGTTFKTFVFSGDIVNADIASGAAIALSKLATDPLARANHTGTQTASTISDFDTQVRTNRLDQLTAPTGSVSFNSQKITNLATPTASADAATKAYVDALTIGLDFKESARAATTANITLSGAQTIDGVSIIAGDRVLVKDQTNAEDNGIYVCAAGAWSRATDADASSEVTAGMFCFVTEGSVNEDTGWVLSTNDAITLGTTDLVFTQFTGGSGEVITAGDGLTKTGTTIDVVGTSNRISVSANAVDISSSYVGQATITTLGTITTGVWTGTAIAVANGGTGATAAGTARDNLVAAGYYSTATHGSGTSISISQATHGLRASKGLIVQVQEESSGAVVFADTAITSSGDVTVTFGASQSANSKRVTIIG